MEIGLGRNVRSEMKMKKILGAILLAVFFCILTSAINAQRKSQLGKVCGDPTAACRNRENFQPYELPFEYGKNAVITQSQLFYAIILKSIRLNADDSNCANAIPERDRTDAQILFPHNMVFVMRCWESGQNSYTNVADHVSFIGVYAGTTPAQANAFLKTVKATGKFNRATLRRTRVQINGT